MILFAILLTACGTEENGQEKKFETTKQAPTAEVIQKEPSEKVKNEVNVSTTKKIETYAKNIFKLTTIEGKTLHVDEAENGIIFQEHKDKMVFLIFFGYRCPPCLSEIPVLKKLVEEKGDKLEVIALEVQRLPEEQLKIFKDSKKLNYTILSGEHTENSKFISYIAERSQWTGSIPFLVGIKPSGEVGVVHVGGIGSHEFNKIFNELSK
ncbi:MAG: Thioredoxin [uncultured Sulfurovum sp.]|uniref:Thioredoxin n=1 Tax=uncultured Sulfurovum sp. TaxID=269237 RepID=A0A6S6UE08_9BACT|nr:MAG: Thioredoxin [uncultured Sulfurovum sp.]